MPLTNLIIYTELPICKLQKKTIHTHQKKNLRYKYQFHRADTCYFISNLLLL